MKSRFLTAWPYANDALNIPVAAVESATKEDASYRIDQYGDTSFKAFFVVAPDGLCYCLGERLPKN